MFWALLHRLIVAVTILAFVGGMTLQLMPPKAVFAAATTTATERDCQHMAVPSPQADSSHTMPCKGMDPECIKQMGCLGTPSLPLQLTADFVPFVYDAVAYWMLAESSDGRSIKPELLPPIGL
jgi:hypothetical protein